MEARFREPIDAILIASAWVASSRRKPVAWQVSDVAA
jgi:hypothetical protein